jgi:hypothetical protein
MRKVFLKDRKKEKDEMNEKLEDLKKKRNDGMGKIFGKKEYKIDERINEKNKEIKIVEKIIVNKMEKYMDEMEKDNVDVSRYEIDDGMGKVMGKVFGMRNKKNNEMIES